LVLARVALAAGDHHAAAGHLDALPPGDLTPRATLVRQVLLAAAAIQRGDPRAVGALDGVLQAARHQGYLNTIVTTAPQVTRYLVEHSAQMQPEPFLERIIAATMEVRAAQTGASRSAGPVADPLTAAELRILKLLPTASYLQIAATLFISHNTVKTHLRSIYQKLAVSSRAEAIERAVDLQLL
jgi:LuxR family transcriptional regulator, maltose regulon positive regulatory protein